MVGILYYFPIGSNGLFLGAWKLLVSGRVGKYTSSSRGSVMGKERGRLAAVFHIFFGPAPQIQRLKQLETRGHSMSLSDTQMLHGTGIFTYMKGEKWPHSRGNVGKCFIHGAFGICFHFCLMKRSFKETWEKIHATHFGGIKKDAKVW